MGDLNTGATLIINGMLIVQNYKSGQLGLTFEDAQTQGTGAIIGDIVKKVDERGKYVLSATGYAPEDDTEPGDNSGAADIPRQGATVLSSGFSWGVDQFEGETSSLIHPMNSQLVPDNPGVLVDGGTGKDVITGGSGRDTLYGGEGGDFPSNDRTYRKAA